MNTALIPVTVSVTRVQAPEHFNPHFRDPSDRGSCMDWLHDLRSLEAGALRIPEYLLSTAKHESLTLSQSSHSR